MANWLTLHSRTSTEQVHFVCVGPGSPRSLSLPRAIYAPGCGASAMRCDEDWSLRAGQESAGARRGVSCVPVSDRLGPVAFETGL